jgi:hypothetical protein
MIVPFNTDLTSGPPIVTASLSKPFVDGGYVRSDWTRLEPRHNDFDWSYLDRQISILSAHNKNASIAVDAGQRAPDWLFAMGAQRFNTVVEITRQKDFCQPIRIPIPWDSVFLREWTNFVRAMGSHFASNPAVIVVTVTGIAYRTPEVLLPRSHGGTANGQGKTCSYPNDIENWQSAGYTAKKMNAAFGEIIRAYRAAFRSQWLAMETGERGFPPIGFDGRIDENAADLPEIRFWAAGRQALGIRFIAQVDDLTDFRIEQNLVEFARNGLVAYQQAWPITNDPNCVMNRGQKPCDPMDVLNKTMNIALSTHAVYLELFTKDLANPQFAGVFERVHRDLLTMAH